MNLDQNSRMLKVISLLERDYADTKTALTFKNPLEILVATILSAQCTDKKVNEVTATLFQKYQTPEDYANADLRKLEKQIKPTGFYHNKAKNIKNCCRMLIEKFDGEVPRTMEEILELPGVARKTANIVLSNAYGVIVGIAVDTHVYRLARRLGFTEKKDPNKIEKDLMDLVPSEKWMRITDLLISHGRSICTAKKPNCVGCNLNKLCPSAFTFD
ncbi:MAG: endonuclease III [Promethearchaeati archaeon SRVP18_Atabeyarchaeia-1]